MAATTDEHVGNENCQSEVKRKVPSKTKENIFTGLLIGSVAAVSAMIGFSDTLKMAKNKDPELSAKAWTSPSDVRFGMKALGLGTVVAISGFSVFCVVIMKLMGVSSAQEFDAKMKEKLPKIVPPGPRKDNSDEKKDFESFRELIEYIQTDDKKKTSQGKQAKSAEIIEVKE